MFTSKTHPTHLLGRILNTIGVGALQMCSMRDGGIEGPVDFFIDGGMQGIGPGTVKVLADHVFGVRAHQQVPLQDLSSVHPSGTRAVACEGFPYP